MRIMHSLDVYFVYHAPGSMPEVIASRAPATECLHARVARMRLLYESHPPDPDGCQMVLALIRRAAFRTAFPRVSSWCDAIG